MSDEEYISDEEFLANLQNIDNEKLIQSLQNCGHDGYYNDLYYPIIEEIKRRLSLSPSAEPERKWIPVTEKLPEEEKDVLVSVHFDGHKASTVDLLPPSDYVEIASHVDGVWSSLSDEYKVAWKKHHVVAWMPTPEPYRGE